MLIECNIEAPKGYRIVRFDYPQGNDFVMDHTFIENNIIYEAHYLTEVERISE